MTVAIEKVDTKVIDLETARRLVEDQVDKKGEGHTASCIYVRKSWDVEGAVETFMEPVCIVGCLLVENDYLTLEQMARFDGQTISLINFGVFRDTAHVKLTSEARDYLQRAQFRQDNGYSWGQAYKSAETLAKTWEALRK